MALPNSGACSRVSSMPMEVGRLSGAMPEREGGEGADGGGSAAGGGAGGAAVEA